MIVIDLCCTSEHRFEGWFASSEAYDTQRHELLVCCPICGATDIRRLPSAPALRSSATAAPAQAESTDGLASAMNVLREMARSAENVGTRFADEARRIHNGESEDRRIRGQASRSEITELIEDGIGILPVPPSIKDMH